MRIHGTTHVIPGGIARILARPLILAERAWVLARPVTLAALLLWLGAVGCGGPRLALGPIPLQDDDRYDVPEPKVRERDDYFDVVDYSLYQPVKGIFDLPRHLRAPDRPKQAINATPLDDIQDSTWFTNRIGGRDLTADEVRHGPNAPQGPQASGPWRIVRAKTQGVTPGFTIEDAGGERFVIKFDPASDPELATGAEAISTRLFWAIGYNVPENYLVHFEPARLVIDPKATVRQGGKSRPMTQVDLNAILDKVPPAADGRLRAIASRLIAGKPIGPPMWLGRREDDANDVIPHEHRRELRAYRVFCAWLHHNDSRQINAMDFYVEEEGRHFVKHYLIDFGATLGSRSYAVNLRSEGHEYLVDYGTMFKSLASAGLYERSWTGIEYPTIRGVGRFEAAHFEPGAWRPDYPNPAFDRLTPQDGFWGAKIVMRFTDAHVRAAVEAAEFSDPRATDYLTQILCERRDRVGRYWFAQVNPLDDFEVTTTNGATQLRFADLAVRHGFEAQGAYRVDVEVPGERPRHLEVVTPVVPLGDLHAVGTGALVQVKIRSSRDGGTRWTPDVRLTLHVAPSGPPRLVAISHES